MPSRKRIRVTNRSSYSAEQLKKAVEEVLWQGRSIRSVSIEFNIPRITLIRYVEKSGNQDLDSINFRPSNEHLMVFTQDEEVLLKQVLQQACDIHYGLSAKQGRMMAYEFAVANNKQNIKISWSRDGMAGSEWMVNFLRRNNFSLRTSEQTNSIKATSCNKAKNIKMFLKTLREIKAKYNLQGDDIYNLDETAVTTARWPPRVLTITGRKAVGPNTSAKKGDVVTILGIVGATGRCVPPILIFPRARFKESMLVGTTPGTKGATSLTGLMNSALLLPALQHFVQHERPTKERPKLIILDNHESHISIGALNYSKENYVLLLTLPPHCEKLQPLEIGVFGPFKTFYNGACDRWMINHPGKAITVFDVGSLIGEAFLQAFTPEYICSGFRTTGVCPFFDHFLDDRPEPQRSLEDSQFSPLAVKEELASSENSEPD